MYVAVADLVPLHELYSQGLYLQAFAHAQAIGPLKTWENTPARLLAGRLAMQLGAPRLGHALHQLAWRATPTDPEATYYHARTIMERHGPLAAWRFLRRQDDFADAAPSVRADWFALYGFVAGQLRDWERAERWLQRAEALAPDSPWVAVERAAVLEAAERLDDAMTAARRSLELRPWFRPGVQAVAHLLQRLGRDPESLDLLTEAAGRLESAAVVAQLAGIQMELGRPHDARRSYERFAELSPLMEPTVAHWLAGRRCDAAYFSGDRAAAQTFAEQATDVPFFVEVAKELARTAADAPRARLDVPVAAPGPTSAACLAALAAFWGGPTAGERLAASRFADGPSDGLPDPRERQAAEADGWYVREFTVTAEAVANLLGRGVPFAISAVEGNFSQMTLLIGHDQQRGTLFLREPANRRSQEVLTEPFLKRYLSTGPRGLVLVPADRPDLLAGLDLPEAGTYDLLHQVQAALLRHDRPAAAATLAALDAAAPGSRAGWQARFALARADAYPADQLAALDGWLAFFPDDTTIQIARLNALRDLGRLDERLALLRRLAAAPDADPVFALHLAQALIAEGRETAEARRLLRRVARARPHLAGAYYLLGTLHWEDRAYPEALELFRFAAGIDDPDDQFAQTYFRAARVRNQVPEALRFLQARQERPGAPPAAARARVAALLDLGRTADALAALDRALAAHPTDGALKLFAADIQEGFGEPARADALLEEARERVPEPLRLRAAARLAERRAEPGAALQLWRAVLAAEPLAADAHRELARLLADIEGRRAVLGHFEAATAARPDFYPLRQLYAEWLRGEPFAVVGPALSAMVARFPADAWARRELALHLADQGRRDESLAELNAARELDASSASAFCVTGRVYTLAGRPDDARAAYREALRRSADNEVALSELMALAVCPEDRREALSFVLSELVRQPTGGEGLFAYRDQSANLLEPEELLAALQQVLDAHPDRWHAWSAVVQQYARMGRLDEARELACGAVGRFPLAVRAYLDLAEIYRIVEDDDARLDALSDALRVAPALGPAARELAEALEENGEADAGLRVLRQAVGRGPLDPLNHGFLAEALWQQGESETALARVEHALRLDPGYDWAWRALAEWSERLECRERLPALARDLTARRAGDARAWLALTRALPGPEHVPEVLTALDRAIALNPRAVEAYDLKAERLAELGRFDEALAACRAAAGVVTPPRLPAPTPTADSTGEPKAPDPGAIRTSASENDLPLVLQGRMAWIEARRGNYAAAIPPMQALVALEPAYYWGWQQLADWYNETGRPASYLEAASELVRLRPDNPIALARRGEARLQTGDREGGKADLRQAQQLAPDYPPAGMALFDAYLTDDELDAARATLAMLQEHIGDEFVLARQAHLAARTEDRDTALEALRRICEVAEGGAAWPIQSTVAALRAESWSQEADEVLLGATHEKAFHPLAAVLWVDGPAGQAAPLEERVAALDRAIAVAPHFLQAHDHKAELLAHARRFDEALAACRPPGPGDEPPLPLRGRAAWVEAVRGDWDRAIRQMRAVLAGTPDYLWGWQQLAFWYNACNAPKEFLDAAEHWARLTPRDPDALSTRGEARLQAGDHAGAKEDFRQAFGLDPHHLFAGLHLFDAQLSDDELDDAAETLQQLQETSDKPLVTVCALRLAGRRGEPDEAARRLRELTADAEVPGPLLQRATDTLLDHGWEDLVDTVLAEALQTESAHPLVGRLWVERRLAREDWRCADRLAGLLPRGELGRQALGAYVDALGRPERAGRLHACIQQHGEALRADPATWAKVGRALVGVRNYTFAAAWMADWATRQPPEPWMLLPLALALRALHRTEEAHRVSAHAAELPERDDASAAHAAWLAYDAALAGDATAAAERLRPIDAARLDPAHRLVFALARAMMQVRQAPAGERAGAFGEARRQLRTAATEVRAPDPALVRAYQHGVRRIARDTGGLRAWAWAIAQKLHPPH